MKIYVILILSLIFQVVANAQWSAPVNLSPNAVSAGLNESMGSCIGVSGDTVHVVWTDKLNTTTAALYYTRSINAGLTWSNPVALTDVAANGWNPAIAVNGLNIHLVWRNIVNNVRLSYYKRSTDGGRSWCSNVMLDSAVADWPAVAVSGYNIYVVNDIVTSSSPYNTEIFFIKSTDNGKTWSTHKQITFSTGRSEDEAITAQGSNIYMSWNDNRNGQMQIFYKHSSDYGETWEPEVAVAPPSCYSTMVSADSANIDIPYAGATSGKYQLHLVQSTDNGVSWGTNIDLTKDTAKTYAYPYMVRDGNDLHLTYLKAGVGGQYLHSGDGGKSWDAPVNFCFSGITTFIAFSGSVLHVIVPDSGHINYFRNPTGNPVKQKIVKLPVTVTQNSSSVKKYDIYELTMLNNTSYPNPYDGVDINAVITSPTSKKYNVGGFYYGPNTWKLRFAPMEEGTWTWTLNYNDGKGTFDTSGTFSSISSNASGFLRIHPKNPCRFMTEGDGKAFYPLGYDDPYETSEVFFLNTTAAGNNFQRAYGGATNNFLKAFNVNNSGMCTYDTAFGKQGDQFSELLHKYGMKYLMTFFNSSPTMDLTSNPTARQALYNYHKYIINRYGAYVDAWEFFNEQSNVPQSYLDSISNFIHKIDPYHHLITISYDQPQDNQSCIDFIGDHHYIGNDDIDLDNVMGINTYRTKYNKPVLYGEGGNNSPQGAYSPLRYRIQIWTAFFSEGGVLFWKGGAKSSVDVSQNGGGAGIANQYISFEEGAESKVLSDFSSNFDPEATPITPTLTPANQMRCYGLASKVDLGIYFVHSSNHNSIISGATVKTNIPTDMYGQWIDPATGNLVQTLSVKAGIQTLQIPPFKTDIVLRLLQVTTQSVLQFSTPSYTVNGDQSRITLYVNRIGGNFSTPVSVDYNTSDISAKSGIDYSESKGTLNWAANDSSPKIITVPLIVSSNLKPDITFNVVLSNPSAGALTGNSGIAMVTKYNSVVNSGAFSASYYTVSQNAGVLNVQVNRLGNGVGPMSVYYATRGAGGTDFVAIPDGKNTLNWADGDMSPKTIPITILNTAAAGKQFYVTLNDNGWSVPGSSGGSFVRAEVTILNSNSSPGVLTFTGNTGLTMNGYGYAACKYSVKSSAGSISIPVSRVGGSAGAVSVTYSTSSQSLHVGTAISVIDYKDQSGTLSWADGDKADKLITIPIINNNKIELLNTTFYVYLGNPSGNALTSNPTVAEVTIIQSNKKPTISSIGDITIIQDSSASTSFTIDGNSPDSLIIFAKSTNLFLLPINKIIFGGKSQNRTLALTPIINQFGESNVSIYVTDGKDTASTTFHLTVKEKPNSVPELNNEKKLIVFPNPAIEFITISEFSGEVKIIDILGRIILIVNVQNNEKVDISGMNSGLYFIKIKDKIKVFVKI